jgi:hypothetical protein
VATTTIAAMAALGVRSGSLAFACLQRTRSKQGFGERVLVCTIRRMLVLATSFGE